MIRGRVPEPTALRRVDGNPGKRGYNAAEPIPPGGLPDCPAHLGDEARAEWHRLAETLHGMGVLTTVDRGCLAAYCQAWEHDGERTALTRIGSSAGSEGTRRGT